MTQDYSRISLLRSLLICLCFSSVIGIKAKAEDNNQENVKYKTLLAIKTNLISDAFLTPSLSIEVPMINDHWSLDVTGEYNNWDAWHDHKWRHWTVQPEIRYWFKESFSHWFVGAHFLGGEFNVGNLHHRLPFFWGKMHDMKDFRYQGNFIGGGLGVGYAWQWGRHWGLSAELGMGYMRIKSDKFECAGCQQKVDEDSKYNYLGPTKAALNLIYRFNERKEVPAPVIEEPVEIPARPTISPAYIFVRPVAEVVKERSLEGQAFIEFEVNKTDIQPDRANNRVELGKIIASIDSVRNNPDTKISSLSIKGFASPDGPYDKNAILAKGRTEALSNYVRKLYKFDKKDIATSSEPEDWEGFRKLVDASDLPHRKELLDIINSKSLNVDQKEARIKKNYPGDYDIMRNDILMRLRHSDYVIKYTIRSYSSIEEIREVLKTRPSNLSLAEFYTAAEGYTEGTEDFNQIFLTAVQFYPNDEAANVNAANAYMAEGNLPQARRHLERAGSSREATYAIGIYNALTGNYNEAIEAFKIAQAAGIDEATKMIEQINQIRIWDSTWANEGQTSPER